MSKIQKINGVRLWQRLMTMGEIGATAAGGCNRQALTKADKQGRELFMEWAKDAGCELRIDAIGNIFARRAGSDNSLPVVLTGSHLDTQPTGGKWDGIFGVLAGLEVVESLNDAEIITRHPIEVAVWTNEEGCRFSTAMMGSAVWTGAMPIEDAYALEDSDGISVKQALEKIGHLGDAISRPSNVKAAFEAHIEQGPVLENAGETIGVVTGVQHMSRHLITIIGQEAHAGPTPMELRKDPMMALAEFLPQFYAIAEQHAPHGRVTFGFINASPGSSNTVPGALTLTADIRHPIESNYNQMMTECEAAVTASCKRLGLPFRYESLWHAPGVDFAEDCINAVRHAIEQFDYPHRELFSGAGHDACNLAAVAPTSMIFIPCKDGLSHNEAEFASQEHCEAGANILLHAIRNMAA